jgi:hypothetical protein
VPAAVKDKVMQIVAPPAAAGGTKMALAAVELPGKVIAVPMQLEAHVVVVVVKVVQLLLPQLVLVAQAAQDYKIILMETTITMLEEEAAADTHQLLRVRLVA